LLQIHDLALSARSSFTRGGGDGQSSLCLHVRLTRTDRCAAPRPAVYYYSRAMPRLLIYVMNEADGRESPRDEENGRGIFVPARKITCNARGAPLTRPFRTRARARSMKPVIKFARVLTRAKHPARSSSLTDIRRVCVYVCIYIYIYMRVAGNESGTRFSKISFARKQKERTRVCFALCADFAASRNYSLIANCHPRVISSRSRFLPSFSHRDIRRTITASRYHVTQSKCELRKSGWELRAAHAD